MRGLINEIRNKVASLHAALTTGTRIANLDNLNVASNTLAPASTALSNATWTNALAGAIATYIATPAQSPIKSIQTGYVDTNSALWGASTGEDAVNVNVTLGVAVVVAKSIVLVQPGSYDGGSLGSPGTPIPVTARLTSTTNLRVSKAYSIGFDIMRCRWTVIEFN